MVLKFIPAKPGFRTGQFLLFKNPEFVIECFNTKEASDSLRKLDQARKDGFHVAGYFAYESLNSIHEISNHQSSKPLISMAAYKEYQIFPEDNLNNVLAIWKNHFTQGTFQLLEDSACNDTNFEFKDRCKKANLKYKKLEKQRQQFHDAIQKIKTRLVAGDTYQINYTSTSEWHFDGNPISLFKFLHEQQPTSQSALILSGGRSILSFSPESFFTISNQENTYQISTQPMKGTAARSTNKKQDLYNLNFLKHDKKNRAENLMIVDLMRNDLGQVAVNGTVHTRELFQTQTHPTLHQMTSTIEANISQKTYENCFQELFAKIFPAGSITGAPKISSQKIIQELEQSNRGLYTGSIGFALACDPDQKNTGFQNLQKIPVVDFNVAIRTLDIDLLQKKALYGSGCGIVFDSDPELEWQEFLLKRSFIAAAFDDFHLIETIRLANGETPELEWHISRLQNGIRDIFKASREKIKNDMFKLNERLKSLKKSHPVGDFKIRIGYYRKKIRYEIVSVHKTRNTSRPNTIFFSSDKVFSGSSLASYKSSDRVLYDIWWQIAQSEGFSDVIFLNEKNEIVECATQNLLIYTSARQWVTPDLNSGCLYGIGLQVLINKFPKIIFKKIHKDDLRKARAIFSINSVNGLRRAKIDFDFITNR